MIDDSMKTQLKELFQRLEGSVVFNLRKSEHEKQAELKDMLTNIAALSSKIELEDCEETSRSPSFFISHEGKSTGISFVGIPGGHEFSSLILAILNADKKGKLPDDATIARIKNLKGPIDIRTIVSLSCENCPEVVQSLNLIAALHDEFSHEMIDGAFYQKELNRLQLGGVPAVLNTEDDLLSSGKISFLQLLEVLEQRYGKLNSGSPDKTDLGSFDVTVIGAGPAGVSAAIYTARKGLKTLILTDRLGGQLQDTKGIENMISIPYTEGPELSAKLAEHMNAYDITVLENRRVEKVDGHEPSRIELTSGEFLLSRAVVVATGAKWRELNIPGEKEYIGRGVAFCPHCDGPYYKGKDVAVVGGGNSGVEAAIDLANIVNSVVIIEYGDKLKADQVLIDKARGMKNVRIVTSAETKEILGDGSKVKGLRFQDRKSQEISELDLDGVFVQIGLSPNSQFVRDQVAVNSYGEIHVDQKGKTSQSGIYAAGDVTTVAYKQIVVAMGEGAKVGLAVAESLL